MTGVTEWPSDRVTEWLSDRVTEWPSDWETGWQEASQTIDRMVYFNNNIITYHHDSGLVCCHWSVCLKQTVALWKDMDMSPFWCYLCCIQCGLLGCWWIGSLGLVNIVWRRLFSVIFSNCRKSLCVPCDWLGKWPWQCYGHSGNRSGGLSSDSHIFLGSDLV